MKDRRATWRMVPAGYGARIVDSDGKHASVRITDMSERGAKFVLSESENLTPDFTLLCPRTGIIQRRCRSVWRSGDQIGVEFTEITHDERLHSDADHLKLALTQ